MTKRRLRLSAEAREKLDALFARSPRAFLLKLAEAVEIDREQGGTELPHDDILSSIPLQLRRAEEANVRERRDIEAALRVAPGVVSNALPFSAFGGFGATAAPLDLSQPPDDERLRHAEEHLQVLGKLDHVAATHGLEAQLFAARSEIAAVLRSLKEALVKELRAPQFAAAAEAYRRPVLRLARDVLAKWELNELANAARAA